MADPMAEFNRKVIDEFHANAGKVGGPFAGAPMVLLHHTGGKSGKAYCAKHSGWTSQAERHGSKD